MTRRKRRCWRVVGHAMGYSFEVMGLGLKAVSKGHWPTKQEAAARAREFVEAGQREIEELQRHRQVQVQLANVVLTPGGGRQQTKRIGGSNG